MKTASFGSMTDYDAEAQQLADRKKYAEALRQQGQQAVPNGQMVGNQFVATHPLQHLASALRQYSGQRDLQDVRTAEQGLSQRKQSDLADYLKSMPSATTTTDQQLVGDRPGAGSFEPVSTTKQPTPEDFMNWSMQGLKFGPQVAQLGGNMANQAQQRDFQNRQFEQQTADRQAALKQAELQFIGKMEDSRLSRKEREEAAVRLEQLRIDGRREMAQLTAGLAASNRTPAAPVLTTVMRDGKPTVIDARTKEVIGDAVVKGNETGPSGKSLPPNVISKISEASQTFEEFDGLRNTFENSFGGYGADFAGNAANLIRRNVTGDKDGQADWWSRYQSQKNVIRNRLFGSALTATEKAEFDKAMISPGMTPEVIRTNLQRQAEQIAKAEQKMIRAYGIGGYSTEQLDELTSGRYSKPPTFDAPAPASPGLPSADAIEAELQRRRGGK